MKSKEELYKEATATPLGGNLWIVGFKPTEVEKILGFKSGAIFRVYAKSEKEAIYKAVRLYMKKYGGG